MVVRGQFLADALADIGRVVDEGSKDFAIVITRNPEPVFVCYGVRNKETRVDEFLSSSLAKARFVLKELQKDMDKGFDRDRSETEPAGDGMPPGAFFGAPGSGPGRLS